MLVVNVTDRWIALPLRKLSFGSPPFVRPTMELTATVFSKGSHALSVFHPKQIKDNNCNIEEQCRH